MKRREVETLLRKHLLPELPGFRCKGRLLFAEPLEHLLRGFYFDASQDPDVFYPTVFIQPLFLPSEHLWFNYGRRLNTAPHRINRDDPAQTMAAVLDSVKKEGQSFLKMAQSPGDLAHIWRSDDPYIAEAATYSLILADRMTEALQALDHLDARCNGYLAEPPYLPYLAEMLGRSQMIRVRLTRDPSEAIKLLEEWAEYTLDYLRLP